MMRGDEHRYAAIRLSSELNAQINDLAGTLAQLQQLDDHAPCPVAAALDGIRSQVAAALTTLDMDALTARVALTGYSEEVDHLTDRLDAHVQELCRAVDDRCQATLENIRLSLESDDDDRYGRALDILHSRCAATPVARLAAAHETHRQLESLTHEQ